MRVLVTGGAGFIGANLCRELVGRGHEVAVLDDLSTGDAANLAGLQGSGDPAGGAGGQVELHVGSILDRAALDTVVPGADAVVHLAALGSVPRSVADPEASHAANTTGTLEVLEAARRHGMPHVVLASSSSVYGANPQLPKHEGLVPQPVSPYAASKLAAEAYALAWSATYGLDVLAFRFFNVFGPLQPAGHAYAAVIPAFVDAAVAGRPLPIHGDGSQSRDFTYVGTVARTLADALERRVADPEPVNLAFGSRITLLEVVAAIEEVLGHPVAREHLPRRAGDVDHSQADPTRLLARFPDVEAVPFEAGLRATVDWFRTLG